MVRDDFTMQMKASSISIAFLALVGFTAFLAEIADTLKTVKLYVFGNLNFKVKFFCVIEKKKQ